MFYQVDLLLPCQVCLADSVVEGDEPGGIGCCSSVALVVFPVRWKRRQGSGRAVIWAVFTVVVVEDAFFCFTKMKTLED